MKENETKQTANVLEALPNLNFRVRLEDGREIIAYAAGKIRLNRIRILPGDKVSVITTPYDKNRGRIVYRLR